jgi:hypothetical protein
MFPKYSDLNTSLPNNITYPSTPQLVLISWIDAITIGGEGWIDKNKALNYAQDPLPIMFTAGFVLHEDADHFAVTNTVGPDETAQINKIPKRMIVAIQDLNYGRAEEHKT